MNKPFQSLTQSLDRLVVHYIDSIVNLGPDDPEFVENCWDLEMSLNNKYGLLINLEPIKDWVVMFGKDLHTITITEKIYLCIGFKSWQSPVDPYVY